MEDKSIVVTTISSSILSIGLTLKLMILGGVIFVGANSYALMELKKARKAKEEFSNFDYFSSFLVAVFSGLMFWFVSIMFIDNWVASWIAAGMGSFMGITGISKLGDAFIEMLTNMVSKK